MELEIIGIPAITAIVCFVMYIYKKLVTGKAELWTNLIPVWAGILGLALGLVAFYCAPEIMPADNVMMAVVNGIASGLMAVGANQIFKQIKKSNQEKEAAKEETKAADEAKA